MVEWGHEFWHATAATERHDDEQPLPAGPTQLHSQARGPTLQPFPNPHSDNMLDNLLLQQAVQAGVFVFWQRKSRLASKSTLHDNMDLVQDFSCLQRRPWLGMYRSLEQ